MFLISIETFISLYFRIFFVKWCVIVIDLKIYLCNLILKSFSNNVNIIFKNRNKYLHISNECLVRHRTIRTKRSFSSHNTLLIQWHCLHCLDALCSSRRSARSVLTMIFLFCQTWSLYSRSRRWSMLNKVYTRDQQVEIKSWDKM